MEYQSQHEMVLGYIRKNGGITAREAQTFLGVERLASRINELRQGGYNILTIMTNGKNRYGRPTRYATYVEEKK